MLNMGLLTLFGSIFIYFLFLVSVHMWLSHVSFHQLCRQTFKCNFSIILITLYLKSSFFFRPFFPPSNSNDVNEKTLTFHHKKRQRSESHFLVFTSKRTLLIPWADPLIQSLIYSFVHSFSQWSVALKVLQSPFYIYRLFHNPPQLCSIFS